MKNIIQNVMQILLELNFILDKQQKKRAFWVLLVLIISSLFELMGVSVVLPFIQAILTPEKLLQNPYVNSIAQSLGIKEASGLLLLMGIALIVIYILKNVYMIFSYFIQYDYSTRIQKELSVKMLKSYISRPYTFFLETNSSEILRGCRDDINYLYYIINYIQSIVVELFSVALISIFIVYTDPVIAIDIILLMGIVLIGIIGILKPVLKQAGKKNIQVVTEKNKNILQAVSGIKEIFVMQRKKIFIDKYDTSSEIARKVQRTYDTLNSSPDRIVEGVCISGIIGIVCFQIMRNDINAIEFVPKLGAFAMAAFKILPSIGKLANRINGIVYFRPSLSNVYENMKKVEEYNHEQEMYALEYAEAYKDINEREEIKFNRELSVKHIVWQYENQKRPVLMDATVSIRKGESVAFIGASGAGKTTLADVILGLLKPQQGCVEMDGVDVYSIPMQWAKIVSYVPQAVYLLDDTVRNNIAFGLPKDEITDDKIWEALDRAQLRAFVENLPQKLDTIVGERGVKFSGGQKQRIAIARALYNEPEILILDEATAALDNETENAVMESIDALQGQITMIIVAHRLTTIRNCDKIYEIKDGRAIVRSKEEVLGEA